MPHLNGRVFSITFGVLLPLTQSVPITITYPEALAGCNVKVFRPPTFPDGISLHGTAKQDGQVTVTAINALALNLTIAQMNYYIQIEYQQQSY